MATYNLGRVLPRFRGQWDPTINYDKLDVVYFEGSSYMAISDNINKRPDENESDWVLSAAKGEPGEPGKDGPTYKAGKGISIVNNVISATGGGDEEGGETYFNGFGIDIDLATNQINAEVKATFDVSTEWKEIEMTGLSESDIENWNERNVFYYRGKTYYSNGANHNYVLNGTKWDKQAWIGFTDIYGRDIYIDTKGVMRYYAGNIIMKYDDDNGWEQDTINISNCYGRYMVNGLDGYDYYFENSSKMYYHEPDGTSTWTKFTGAYNINAAYIWSDENTTYYSNGSNQYYFDYDRIRWVPMTWRGDKRDISGFNVWRQGNNILYSDGANTYQLKYGDTWTRIASTSDIYGVAVIEYDDNNVFHFYDGDAKQLVIGERHYITKHGDELPTKNYVDNNGVVRMGEGVSFKTWKKLDKSIRLFKDKYSSIWIDDIKYVFNTTNQTYLLKSSELYRWKYDSLTFEYVKNVNVISGENLYVLNNQVHFSDGLQQLVFDEATEEFTEFHEWDEFSKLSDLRGRYMCSNGNEVVGLIYSLVPDLDKDLTLLYKNGKWNVYQLKATGGRINSDIHIWHDRDGNFYNKGHKLVGDEWIDGDYQKALTTKDVWHDLEGHSFYQSECVDTGYKARWDWEMPDGMNLIGDRIFNDGTHTFMIDGYTIYSLIKPKLEDSLHNIYMNENDVRYLINDSLGYINNRLKAL